MSKKPISVKLKRGKNTYEILVHHGTVDRWRDGKLGWGKVTYADEVFKNASKGDRYTDNDLESEFGTCNVEECMQIIAREGDVQLTTEDRRKMIEDTRKQIVQYIHKHYVNPKTKSPHPTIAIENALKQQRYVVTEEPVERQVQKIMKKMIEVLPMRKNEITTMMGTFTIPNEHMGKVQGVLGKYANIVSQNYGARECTVEVSFTSSDFDALNLAILQASKNESRFEASGSSGGSAQPDNSNKSEKNLRKKKKKKKGKSGKGWDY